MTGSARAAVLEHLAAFNAHDSARLLAGLAPEVVWRTGTDRFAGRAALAAIFDDGLWRREPRLEVRSVIGDGPDVAAELEERLEFEGAERVFAIAVFLTVRDGLITHATVYREGSADLHGRR